MRLGVPRAEKVRLRFVWSAVHLPDFFVLRCGRKQLPHDVVWVVIHRKSGSGVILKTKMPKLPRSRRDFVDGEVHLIGAPHGVLTAHDYLGLGADAARVVRNRFAQAAYCEGNMDTSHLKCLWVITKSIVQHPNRRGKLKFDMPDITFCGNTGIMRAQLPHLRGLQVFEAVARHRNMSRAGVELAIGQSAVTQQVSRLETYFGLTLVEREPSGVRLTQDGELLARRLRPAMDDIRAVVTELLESQRYVGSVSVVTLGAFAYRWLIPRLSTFHLAHPDIDVQLVAASTLGELARTDVDVSVRCGSGQWPGHHAEYLMANQMFPVISPRLCRKDEAPSPEDLRAHAWIYVDAEPRRAEWQSWLSMTSQTTLKGNGEIHVASSIHAIEAAIAGLGIALGHTPFVWDALEAENLVAIEPAVPAQEGDYHIVSIESQARTAKISVFREWLLAQT